MISRPPILTITFIACCSAFALQANGATVIDANDYGLKADGGADDGPAIARMLDDALKVDGPVVLRFPRSKTIRAATAPERYVFRFDGARDITIDGGGSTFLLSAETRLLRMRESRNITLGNFNVDFDPLPFADATVTTVNAKERFIDVRAMDGSTPLPTGGPTKQDGEQAFFGMLWYPGPYSTISRHYFIDRMEAGDEPGTARVHANERSKKFDDIKPGLWRISLPVPGIAHCYGPGACFDIFDNENVALSDIELWSAPWFGFRVFRNAGDVTFHRVNIRPKPDSGRLTSTWRDGFHAKGNSGRLLWEDCVLSGMNDDAFNISTHVSHITQVVSPTEVIVLQTYPLKRMPWREGATFAAADFDARTLLGKSKIAKVTNSTEERFIKDMPAATPVTLTLEKPIKGLNKGALVWQPETSNPDVTLRRCRIEKSCRMRSPMMIEECDVTALLWFYASKIEGPFPSSITVRDSVLRRGRGNPRTAVSFVGRATAGNGPSAVHDIVFERNEVWGDFLMRGVDNARVVGNRFLEEGAKTVIEDCPGLIHED